METKCYRDCRRQLVLSGHEKSKAIRLEFSNLNISQSRYFPGSVFRTIIWRPDESTLLWRKMLGICFIWTWKFGSYRTTIFGLQQQSDGTITWICFSARAWHLMETKCYRGSCRLLVLSGHENLEAIWQEFSVLNVSHLKSFRGSVFRITIWRPDERILLWR